MGIKVQIDGVGQVELDDGFQGLTPEQQQATIDEIASSSAKRSAPEATPSAPAPKAATGTPSATQGPRGSQRTYQALERFVQSKYPNVKFTSDYRDPEHNRKVGGVEGSYHTTYQAVDMTGLSDSERKQLRQDLASAGAPPREYLFHNAGSGDHLHVAADTVSDDFLKQWGPQAAPAPDQPAAIPERTPDRQAEIDSTIAQATGLIQAGKEQEAIELLGQHRLNISPGELEAFKQGKRSAGFGMRRNDAAPAPDERTWGDTALEAAKSVGKGAVGGVGGLVDMASEAVTAPFMDVPLDKDIGTAWNPGARDALRGLFDKLAGAPQATTDGERYINAAGELTGEFAVPLGSLNRTNKARQALEILGGGVASGVTGEAAHDVAPILGADPDTARTVGQLAGGVVGAGLPNAGRAIAAARDARFVGKQASKNPFVSYDKEISQELRDRVVKGSASSPTDPVGRAAVTAKQINSLEASYLTGVRERIAKLGVDEPTRRQISDVITNKHSIPVEELEFLKSIPGGDAVYHGIVKTQRLRALTPEIKRKGLTNFVKGTLDAVGAVTGGIASGGSLLPIAGGAVVGRALRRALASGEEARVHAAERVIQRGKAYDKLKVGPSGQREAYANLDHKYRETVAAQEAKEHATLEAAERSRELTAAEKQRKAALKEQRFGMTEREYANYTARKSAADEALANPVEAAPTTRAAKAARALQRLEQSNRSAELRFDQRLEKATAAPKAPKLTTEQALYKVSIAQGARGNYEMYARPLGVPESEVARILPKVDTSDIPAHEMEQFVNGFPISRPVQKALLPRIRKALTDEGVTPATATNKATQARPQAEAAATDRHYRPVEDQARYDRGKGHAQRLQNYERSQMEHQLPKEVVEATKSDIDHIIEVARTGEGGIRYFDEQTVPKLKQMGLMDDDIEDIRSHVQRIVSHKRYQTDAQFEAGAIRK